MCISNKCLIFGPRQARARKVEHRETVHSDTHCRREIPIILNHTERYHRTHAESLVVQVDTVILPAINDCQSEPI